MFRKTLDYASHHAIAIVALVCSILALAGASYAAITLPKNSVGNVQLQRGAVSPPKLSKQIGAYARLYAVVRDNGTLVYSSPKAKVRSWANIRGGVLGTVEWPGVKLGRRCSPIATANGTTAPAAVTATIANGRSVNVLIGAPANLTIAVFC